MAGKQIVKSTKQNMSDEILLCQIKEQKTMPERDIQAERKTDIGIKTKQKNLSHGLKEN